MHRKRAIFFHVFSAAVLAASVLVGCLCFTGVFWRTWEALRDLGLSVAYYFTAIFGFDVVKPTVTTLPRDFFEGLPEAWEQFVPWLQAFGKKLIEKENVLEYLLHVVRIIGNVALVLAFCLPFAILFLVLLWRVIKTKNKDHGKESKPLMLFLEFRRVVILRVKYFVLAYVKFLKKYKAYPIAFACVWAYFFNIGTVIVEFFAFYFYFSASFDLEGIFIMLMKLVSDLLPMILFLPLWVWAIVAIVVFDYVRKEHAYKKLKSTEKKNREFIKERPVSILLVGSMRTGKTKMMSDMGLSIQEIFREQALKDMRDIDMKFPQFPWINFEQFLKRAIRSGRLPTLASVEAFIEELNVIAHYKTKLAKDHFLRRLKKWGYKYDDFNFGYDITTFGDKYNNGLKYENLFDALSVYGRLYYIYINPTSLVSNYTVRSDKNLEDEGNFPMWKDDFFKCPPVEKKTSVMSHILDQNMERLGRVTEENDPYKDAFEGGVLMTSEVDKERGNQFDTKGQDKNAEEVNQVNDLYNEHLKMIGHSATIYFFSYIRWLGDSQRSDSLGANTRELCDIVDIVDKGKSKIILPFFALEEALFLISDKLFRKIYDKYRFHRGDNTLTIYLLKGLHGLIYNHYKRIENTFSVCAVKVKVYAGSMDEKGKECKYYLSSKKIYADRYSSDCFHDFFKKKALRSKVGIYGLPQYQGLMPTYDELKAQKSHFINKIDKAFDGKFCVKQVKPQAEEEKPTKSRKNTSAK